MLTASSAFTNAMKSAYRFMHWKVTVVNGSQTAVIQDAHLYGMNGTEVGYSQRRMSIGEFCRNTWSLVTDTSVAIPWNGSKFSVSVTIDGAADEVPLGVYYVKSADLSDNMGRVTVLGYSTPDQMEEDYNTEWLDNTALGIVAHIETYTGMTFDNKALLTDFPVTAVPDGVSNSGMLAYIAGYSGYNIRTTRTGGLHLYRYTDCGYTIGRDVQFMDGLSDIPDKSVDINSLTVGEYSAGAGYGINYSNPYMTQEQVTAVWEAIGRFSYMNVSVAFRGNPILEIGDIVSVIQADGLPIAVPVMQMKYSIDGGLRCDLTAVDNATQTVAMKKTALDRKLATVADQYREAVEKAMEKLTGVNGYYTDLYDGDIKIGWQITDTLPNEDGTVSNTTKGWRFVQGGLFYSDDGFGSLTTAMTADGTIIGSLIAADSILTRSLTVEARNVIEGTTMNMEFNSEGLRIRKLNEDYTEASDYSSLFNNEGMIVGTGYSDGEFDVESLSAQGDTVVASKLKSQESLSVNTQRAEAILRSYSDNTFDTGVQLAWFFIPKSVI